MRTNTVTVLASGLFYEQDGQWVRSGEEIELFSDAAVAHPGPHKVIFPLDLATGASHSVLRPNGSGRSVFL